MIMDILAAISLGTGKENNKSEGRISRKFKIFEPEMWRQIIVQGTFQVLVNLVLIFFGGMIFKKKYNLVTTDPRNPNKVYVDTFIFHTFFMLTMFNQICARVVEKNEMNVFKTILSNPIFWIVWAAEMGIQHLMFIWSATTATGSKILGLYPLPFEYMVISTLIGSLSLIIHMIQTKIPLKAFDSLEQKVGLESGNATQVADGFIHKVLGCMKCNKNDDDDDDDDNFVRLPKYLEESTTVPGSPKAPKSKKNIPSIN